MKPFNVIVTGEPAYIKSLIGCISYGPVDLITHRYRSSDAEDYKQVKMNFGSLQVDEDYRVDFYGGNNEALFEFIDVQSGVDFKGIIIVLNADDLVALNDFKGLLFKHIMYLNKHALAVAVSGNDYTAIKLAEEQVRQCLSDIGTVAPVFSIDPDNKEEVSLLIESLLVFARPGIHENARGKSSFKLSD